MKKNTLLIMTMLAGMVMFSSAQDDYVYEGFSLTERQVQQALARMEPRDRAFWELFWKAQKIWKRGEKKGKLTEYCRRELKPDEKELIEKLLAFAKDRENDWGYRRDAIQILGERPHVVMIDALKELVWSQPLDAKEQWKRQLNIRTEREVNLRAIIALHCIADERVIPILIEALEHPMGDVRDNAWLCLSKLLVYLEPKALQKIDAMLREGKITWKEHRELREKEMGNMENWREVKALYSEWWERNKGKVKIRWGAAWRSH